MPSAQITRPHQQGRAAPLAQALLGTGPHHPRIHELPVLLLLSSAELSWPSLSTSSCGAVAATRILAKEMLSSRAGPCFRSATANEPPEAKVSQARALQSIEASRPAAAAEL